MQPEGRMLCSSFLTVLEKCVSTNQGSTREPEPAGHWTHSGEISLSSGKTLVFLFKNFQLIGRGPD